MAARNPEHRRLSSRKAHAARYHPDADTTDLDAALADARVEAIKAQAEARNFEARVTKLVAEAPPLSDAQRVRLAAILLTQDGSP